MELEDYRKQIDELDQQLLKLFCQRMDLASEIGAYKREHHLPVFNPTREREILQRVTTQSPTELGIYARVLFETIFDLSRSRQDLDSPGAPDMQKMITDALAETPQIFPADSTVAVQGVEGAYSQQAASRLFPRGAISFFKNWDGVFNAVEKGLCQYGILPIENSTNGTVNQVYDLMRNHNFYIVRSVKLQINHQLLANPGVSPLDITEIISHEQALAQCSKYLKAHFPKVKLTPCSNTAIAAQQVSESQRYDLAAICSGACKQLYGLQTLSDQIQNSDYNYTRFICIAPKMQIFPGADRISLMVSVPHTPGSLYRLMSRFSALGVNLLKLESRPLPGRNFEFMFYFDFEASVYSPEIVQLLSQLAASPDVFVLFGCYSEIN